MKKLVVFCVFTLLVISACEVNINIDDNNDLIDIPALEDIPVDEPVVVEELEETVVEEVDLEDFENVKPAASEAQIIAAFGDKHPEWDLDGIDVSFGENTSLFASGSVGFVGQSGGGYFYAANTENGWVIVADGNGVILCDEIAPYNFPTTLITECWDETNQVLLLR